MVQFRPFLYRCSLDQDVLEADFGEGPADAKQSYFVGNQAFYRKLVMHLPIWCYIPYNAILSAEAVRHEFRVGG